jgi:anti-sigma factor RsiW
MHKDCHDYIGELNDYIDGEIDPELCEEIKAHLGQCANCRLMVDTMRQTVKLVRDGVPQEMPASLQSSLNKLLKSHWDKKFGDKKQP